MLDTNAVELIRRYEKRFSLILVLIALCTFIIVRVIYCKNEREEMIYSEEFDLAAGGNETSNIKDYSKDDSIMKMMNEITRINQEQIVNNENFFGFVTNQSPVIVIQIHNESFHLVKLLESLEQVTAISKAFLIFAHDYYDDFINFMIKAVNFSKYMQIFYPYSSQLHPNYFPGDDAQFCADGYQCFGNKSNRDARLSQQKLFWWWQVNHVFEYLEEMKYYDGYVLFLQHNQYIADDLMYMIEMTSSLIGYRCPQCEMISFGAHLPKTGQFYVDRGDIFIEPFGSTENNFGIAFNRSVWNKIKNLKQHFCYFNDFRWDESLKNVGANTASGKFMMLAPEGPRVLSTACKPSEDKCNRELKVIEAKSFVKLITRGLYPRELQVKPKMDSVVNITQGGNWEDIRDRELCVFMAEKAFKKFDVRSGLGREYV